MTHFPEEKERILVNNWKLQVVLGSSCGNPTLVDTTLLTGGLLWQEHLLSSPGDLLLRSHLTGLQKPGSRNFSVDFRQIATSVCSNVLEKVVKTRWIMVSQVCVSSCDSHLNVTLLPNPVHWLTNKVSLKVLLV